MGHRKEKHLAKVRRQQINKQENAAYYQVGTEWKHGSSDRDIQERRKLQ